jgi:hypothetical protein
LRSWGGAASATVRCSSRWSVIRQQACRTCKLLSLNPSSNFERHAFFSLTQTNEVVAWMHGSGLVEWITKTQTSTSACPCSPSMVTMMILQEWYKNIHSCIWILNISSFFLNRTFFDKEYILISRRYQIHIASATTQCPSGNTDVHSQ